MSAKVITFRSELKSSISDFLADAEMSCTATEESLVALVVAIADYREEGRQLFPQIIICDDLETVLRNVQGSSPIEIGSGLREPETMLHALKKCAPLAEGAWSIWVERQSGTFRFGVYRAPATTAIDERTTLLSTPASADQCAILLAQLAPGVVELISTGRDGLRIHLSGRRQEDTQSDDAQRRVARWWATEIPDERLRESFASFAAGVLHDVLRKGHGALVAVAPAGSDEWVVDAGDAVILGEALDAATKLSAQIDEQTSADLSDVLASVDLLSGMLGSDGITVLDTAGRVVAFNWFIQADASASTGRERGGARHRAFGALKVMVDAGKLAGVFIRSSDGAESAYGGALDA
ncbi:MULTISPECIES: hypothetical protein [Cellulomonas]|uniref:DAC domain-containing protein n=1 Tax=Cellulomonas gelida TaxID=1712 RepID=A0A4Y3KLD5_9CELL|nr:MULTISPECIES: hypothetical protein [Cellulomonas]MCR6705660.1 hypothetical protein [Cellulomonas sp.]GEA84822.1 hypothetical protein CGE01nite_20730 [Cellulomonas gelida]GGL16143.1 hypothetical protein GCM10009774_03160 [Cellulomonas gelida]